ncbi:GNAT family N-acetyltransferase [Tropicibacter naphthalenivorans]|uniref:Putative acetyltransferase n=1 Tax=Tropicibacter naphthalenivorans TaxID=441103 RepID=A0A0P1GWV1_9RHOB|nr:GNAT family N-acetyltransferase [Tropicibacter naphthalenivorans]CUH78464.1 putative acetyltransferase [Tropicibacter naphthalenivorans]SMC80624.1 Acetyltransferase (GNAT) family protein [Tropicibacter naphthalenivorans]
MALSPDANRLLATLDATWPAAAKVEAGPWTLREGRGGGSRVSAATIRGPWRPEDIAAAEKSMRLMGQQPLFMIRPGEMALDRELAALGYEKRDVTNLWVCPIETLTDRKVPLVTAFTIWEPLAIMLELWTQGGIGEERRAVMDRCALPKTGLFGRVSDKPAGTGFAAVHDGIAMVHALLIAEAHRGKGLGGWMMRAAAFWAQRKGALWMSLAATESNVAASALYSALRMEIVGQYHYRILNDAEGDDP